MGSCFCFGSSSATESSDADDEFPELPPESPDTNGQILPTFNLKRYSFADLKSMTRGFSSDAVIGKGVCSRVYTGWVDVEKWGSVVYTGWVEAETMAPSMYGFGIMVAVKKFKRQNALQELQQELKFLRRLCHPNVLKLLGYCFKDRVYEFMQNGSLDKHLYNNTDSSTASICWATRLRIAIGVARGLTFLHSFEDPVIHGCFESSNILLDRSYNPKISVYTNNNNYVFMRSTFAGLDNECIMCIFGVKTDVYSFGLVLLQILTGLPVRDRKNRPYGQSYLVDWAKPQISERANLRSIMDARLDGQYSKDAAFKAAQLVLKCLRDEPQTRPTMKEVLDDLERVERM